jgi:hypothetical protein
MGRQEIVCGPSFGVSWPWKKQQSRRGSHGRTPRLWRIIWFFLLFQYYGSRRLFIQHIIVLLSKRASTSFCRSSERSRSSGSTVSRPETNRGQDSSRQRETQTIVQSSNGTRLFWSSLERHINVVCSSSCTVRSLGYYSYSLSSNKNSSFTFLLDLGCTNVSEYV